MSSFTVLLYLFRPINLLLGAIAVIISAAILGTIDQTFLLIQAILVVVMFNAAANAFNDYMDYETDKINHPNRPIPRGDISQKVALGSAIILFGLGIVMSAFINLQAFFIATFVAVPLMVMYSLRFKGLPLVGNVVVAFILGLTFIFAGAAFGTTWGLPVPALLAFGFTLIREIVKDMADIEGDKAANLNTFPVRFGMKASVWLAIASTVLLSLGTLVPYMLGVYGKKYLIVLILGIEIPLLYVLFMLMKSPTIYTCKLISQILKGCIFAGLLAVYLG